MWLLTTFGFFSAVQKPGTDFLTIRARVASDLDNLRGRYLPELSPTVADAGTDYPFRAMASHQAFAAAAGRMAGDIDYANFKSEVARQMGSARADAYHQVWDVLHKLQPPAAGKPKSGRRKASAFGGIVFNEAGEILLFEPRGHYGGMVWTFPKGRPNGAEAPEATAIREVAEETGIRARILGQVPGEFEGDETITRYFLMRATGTGKARKEETQSICWVTPERARVRIKETINARARARDLQVLQLAMAVAKTLRLV
jgi:8-oxo-dGTP pyrophosphatase MutT (NUDIX family)